MQSDSKFDNLNSSFWANMQVISEKIGYVPKLKGKNVFTKMSIEDINLKVKHLNLKLDAETLELVTDYFNYRTSQIKSIVEDLLQTKEQAISSYLRLKKEINPKVKILYNRQNLLGKSKFGEPFLSEMRKKFPDLKNELKEGKTKKGKKKLNEPLYFSNIINFLLEKHLTHTFDEDPQELIYLTNKEDRVVYCFSRRMDGLYPSRKNPIAMWEIKEYYSGETFGSRISDSVYLTKLDGLEAEIGAKLGVRKPFSYILVDGKEEWGKRGVSYLCRFIDLINQKFVDEVIFGNEVYTRWPELIESWRNNNILESKPSPNKILKD